MRKRVLLITILIIILCAAVAVGWYYYGIKSVQVDVSDWKICRNGEYGYQIKYPKTWKEWPTTGDCRLFYDPKFWNAKDEPGGPEDANIWISILYPEKFPRGPRGPYKEYFENKITLEEFAQWKGRIYVGPGDKFSVEQVDVSLKDNIQGFKVSVERIPGPSVYFTDRSQSKIFELAVTYPLPIQKENVKAFDQILSQMLSTFQFID